MLPRRIAPAEIRKPCFPGESLPRKSGSCASPANCFHGNPEAVLPGRIASTEIRKPWFPGESLPRKSGNVVAPAHRFPENSGAVQPQPIASTEIRERCSPGESLPRKSGSDAAPAHRFRRTADGICKAQGRWKFCKNGLAKCKTVFADLRKRSSQCPAIRNPARACSGVSPVQAWKARKKEFGSSYPRSREISLPDIWELAR